MKPQPLSKPVILSVPPCGMAWTKDEILAAVEWLKQEVKKIRPKIHNEGRLIKKIDEAFAVVKE